MKKSMNNSSGFTLVELMVVVAIIGILSAVAIPNFRQYQAKSKQSEAKIQLAALYTSEVSALSEYDVYATCIRQIGFDPAPRGYYIIGFATAAAANNTQVSARDAGTGCVTATETALAPQSPAPASVLNHIVGFRGTPAPLAIAILGTVMTETTFTAGASGNISTTNASLDNWTITDTKVLSNTVRSL